MNKEEYINIQNKELLDTSQTKEMKDNAMLKAKPELWVEWDFEKNDALGLCIWRMTKGSNRIVNWIDGHGHRWQSNINNRVSGTKCPYCSNKKVLVGFNDMWTTNPELAELLANPHDGYNHMQNSSKKANWRCPSCQWVIKGKRISSIKEKGLFCPKCSDGISTAEKAIYFLLCYLGVDFVFQKKFEWSEGKYYDFYVPSLSLIIEAHGIQHYESRDGWGRPLSEEELNDANKLEMANLNSIKHYLVIDCRESNMDKIKDKMIQSLDGIIEMSISDDQWKEVKKRAMTSLVKQVCDKWLTDKSTRNIADDFNLSRGTIRRYLKMGAEVGLCDYSKELSIKFRNQGIAAKKQQRKTAK